MDFRRTVIKLIQPWVRSMRTMVSRAVVRLVNDAGGVQLIQLEGFEGEILGNVERHQEYGFTSKPFPGAGVVIVAVGGDRSHSLIVACGDRNHRLKNLNDGEVALYDDQDQVIKLGRGGINITTPADKPITFQCGRSSLVIADTAITITTPAVDMVKS